MAKDETNSPISPDFHFQAMSHREFPLTEESVVGEPATCNPLTHQELSPQAAKALRCMIEVRICLKHSWQEPAHLLLGLLAEPDPMITQVLLESGISPGMLCVATAVMLQPKDELHPGYVPLTPQLHQALLRARQEARSNGDLIGTEHLLLGLLAEPDSTITQAFLQLGFLLEILRGALERAIRSGNLKRE